MLDSSPARLWGDIVDKPAGACCERHSDLLPVLHAADDLLSRTSEQGVLAGHSASDTGRLIKVASWAEEYLTKPHPALGRTGPVCPYVGASIRQQRFLLTVLHGAVIQRRETDDIMRRLAQYFLHLEPMTGRLAHRKAIVVLLPDLPEVQAGDIIDAMHQRLKPYFLHLGLMLGEFYRESSKPGLHNAEFRPLRSEIPLLVIRSMVLTDIAFLSDHARFVSAFVRNFQARGREEVLRYLAEKKGSLSDAQVSMLREQAGAGATSAIGCKGEPAT